MLNAIVRQLIKNSQFRTIACIPMRHFQLKSGKKYRYAAREESEFHLV